MLPQGVGLYPGRHGTALLTDAVWLGVVLGHSWCCEDRVGWAEGNL